MASVTAQCSVSQPIFSIRKQDCNGRKAWDNTKVFCIEKLIVSFYTRRPFVVNKQYWTDVSKMSAENEKLHRFTSSRHVRRTTVWPDKYTALPCLRQLGVNQFHLLLKAALLHLYLMVQFVENCPRNCVWYL